MYGSTSQRFTLLLLEEGEDYVADFNAYIFAPGILSDIANGPVTIDETSYQSPGTNKGIHGKLRLCTKSVFFDSEDVSVPILRLPFTQVVSCSALGPKELHMKAKFYTTCKVGNLDRPYVHKQLSKEASVMIRLEFASMDSLIVQLMQVLEISKTSNFIEKGVMLQEFSRQQAANCSFDYRRLTDEFRERILMECRARQVTPLIKQPGVLVITDRGLYFQPLHNLAGGPLVKFHPAAAITSLARRRIALRPTALEVFMQPTESSLYVANDQRWVAPSVMFLFEDQAAREAVHQLLSRLEDLGADVKGSSALQRGSLLEGKGTWLLHVQNAWIHGKVTNLEYLLYLNFAAGRTFNDLAQWPVFPWVLKEYTSEKLDLENHEVFRDLSKPMGALGHPTRLAEARERWQDTNALHDPRDPDSDPGFMYGSHYSTPGYVMYWLVRKTPEQMLRLQNGRFDASDRLFFGIGESWNSSSGRSNTDVKELIPEFFLPGNGDFLVNTKNLPLGKRQNGAQVSNVILPPWAKDAPDFIWKHRQALESRYVQQHLHFWIDLIFGCKQRGAAAVAADNVFRHTSYAGDVDLDAITDPVMRMAKEAMISEFGQTPAQLFDEKQPHPPRQIFQPVPKDPLPGYCSCASQSPEISHTLVHTLLEVSASESMHSVLSSPQPKPPPAPPVPSAPSPLASHGMEAPRSQAESRAAAMRPAAHGTAAQRATAATALPNTAHNSSSGAAPAHQAVQRGRAGLNRLSAGLSRLGAGILSGLQHSQGSAQRSSASGDAAPPAAAHSLNNMAPSSSAAASSRSLPGYAASSATAAAPLLPAPAPHAAECATAAGVFGISDEASGGQNHDRTSGVGGVVASGADDAAAGAIASGSSVEDVSDGFWPSRLHESVKVRHRVELPTSESITAIACMDDFVASGSASGVLRMHSIAGGVQQQQQKLPRPSLVSSLHVPHSSSLASSVVLAACFSKVHAFAPEFGVLAGQFEPHADLITCMSSAPMPGGSALLYTASEDTTVKAWPVDAERNPWMTVAPPLFEIDSPDASIPMAVKAHKHTAAAVMGSDAGHCAVFDARSGQLEWLWQGEAPSIADVALVPSPELCSIVVAAADGQLLLLDMRRSGPAAVLAKVADDKALSCVDTDGNSAIAGSADGSLLVWNLDPAAEQTAKDSEVGISCTGAGLAFKVPLHTSGLGAVQCISIDRHDSQWLLAAGHEHGGISVSALGALQ